jgi:RNA polymerase sigma factor (sigma-70 family)
MATIAPEVPVLARDEAFEKLYRRHVKDVYHYALALLRNPADAEDVTQTTFLNAYRAFQRGEEIRKPQNWLIKIAHNVARTRYARISRRVKEVPLEDHVDHLAVSEEEKPNVEGVLRALGRLPFNQRAALIMRELEGRSYTEIADALDVSVPAVETLIFRARRSLKIRTAALRSILAVPLPTSLTQFFDGGGVAAGGIGTSLLIKAAVALVVGGVATGLGVEHSTSAAAAKQARAAEAPASLSAARVASHAARPAKPQTARTTASSKRSAVGRAVARRLGLTRRGTFRHQPVAQGGAAAASSSAPASAAQAPAAAKPTAVPAPSLPSPTQTVQNVATAVNQTVSQVTSALPVSVPPVPPLPTVTIQLPPPPQLPKLP